MREPFVNGGFYHVYNRGILKLPIFFDETDYRRFTFSLDQFNDTRSVPIFGHPMSKPKKNLVSIIAWCLMPNHFHVFLRQEFRGGVSLFMKKLGIGYTKYINTKYRRSGHVFQGKFMAKTIRHDAYFIHLSRYIHLNPIKKRITKTDLEHTKHPPALLNGYRWSSYLDWIGKNNFPSVLNFELVKEVRQMDAKKYIHFLHDWLKDCGGWTSDVQTDQELKIDLL